MAFNTQYWLHDALLASTAVLAALGIWGSAAEAQVSGLSVQAGHATVATPSATQTVITQSTAKAILNWQSFSISGGTSVQFVQPSSGSVALNRVTGGASAASRAS